MDEKFRNFEEKGSESGGRSPSQTTLPAPDLVSGSIVAERYKIFSVLGRGAMGSVYKVEQIFLKKQFALKTLHAAGASPTVMRRFQQEAQAVSLLNHPNLVQSTDFGVLGNNQPFLVMELLEGDTLKQLLKNKGRLTVEEALEIFIPICFAIGYAHQKGVIHRDIKPSNIVLVPSDNDPHKFTPKIVDFGIAKLKSFEDSEALTRTGEVFGTPWYMSPEQCSGLKVDSRSDIYSLGCVIYEALTGAPPFSGNTALEAMMQHRTETASPLSEASLGSKFPPGIEKIVAKMLAKDPAQRYQDCLSVADDLGAVQRGEEIRSADSGKTAEPVKARSAPPNYGLKHLILVAVSCVAVTGAIAWFLLGAQKAPQPIQSKTVESTHLESSAAGGGTDFEIAEGSFCTIEKNTRLFHFPNKLNCGSLTWWQAKNDESPHKHQAANVISLPTATKVIYEANGQIYELQPGSLNGFHNGDFYAFVVAPGTDASDVIDERNFNKCVKLLSNFDSLRGVLLYTTPLLEAAALDTVGNLPNLRFLVLDRSEPNPEKIARLKNLNQLTVFQGNRLDGSTAILKRLAQGSAIRYLSLTESHFSLKDFDLLSELRSLEVLDLRKNFENEAISNSTRAQIYSNLSRLSNLERVRIERETLCDYGEKIPQSVLSKLKSFKKMSMFIVNGGLDPQERAQLKAVLPTGCYVFTTDDRRDYDVAAWFDCRMRNPDAKNLW